MEVRRYANNPILTARDVPFRVNSIFNAGAVKFNDKYLLLCRVEMPSGASSLVRALSDDGIHFTVDDQPILTPQDHKDFYEYVKWGVEDPRITLVDGHYYILYTGYSPNEPVVMMARTKDFTNFELLGPVSEPVNKDAVLFPQKINGYYWRIDRPLVTRFEGEMWIKRSPDLVHWGNPRCLVHRGRALWESDKIGASTPPIRTDRGWLMLYHGVRIIGTSMIYRQGVLLLDLNDPTKVLGRSLIPVLSPEEEYERSGDVPNVVFSTGWIREADDQIKIYYSGADSNISLAFTTVEDLLEKCDPVEDDRP